MSKAHSKKHQQRRQGPPLGRPAPYIKERPTILIVCEGKNTEPSYFNKFRVSSASVRSVGEGYNTTSLVERAKALSNRKWFRKKGKQFDQVWCVFDADIDPEHPRQAEKFNDAITLAEQYGFRVAYSNQAFEYWLILHFEDHLGEPMHRSLYNDRLNDHLLPFNVDYDGLKSKKISERFFALMEGKDQKTNTHRVKLAIERARKIYNTYDHKNPANEESSTTVFRLVEELLRYS
ncbi:MAG: RloB domain-containing protein [Cryomorphaceae bacterium]|nr:RloB domain-containing protein [Cryomorphaceae bacterium]